MRGNEANNIERYRRLRKNQTDLKAQTSWAERKELNKLGVETIGFSDGGIIKGSMEEKRGNSPHLNPFPQGERR